MIRKPAQAERESSLRRGVEMAASAGTAVQRTGKAAGKGFQLLVLGWITFGMSIGALTAGSFGGTLIGLAFTAAFACLFRYVWNRPID